MKPIEVGIEQPEGLCHMWYTCQTCRKRERIWNSRPRVTPFIVSCPRCKGEMHHTEWELDEYDPNYRPKPGDRIFVDSSIEHLEKFRKEFIDKYWDEGYYPMKERTELWSNKEEALQYFLKRWRFGDPTVITIPPQEGENE